MTRAYPAVILVPTGRVSDRTQGYTKVVVRSLANRLAHVERSEQRVAVHWDKISTTPPSQDPAVRTSSHRVIETDVHECVGKGGGLCGQDQKHGVHPTNGGSRR